MDLIVEARHSSPGRPARPGIHRDPRPLVDIFETRDNRTVTPNLTELLEAPAASMSDDDLLASSRALAQAAARLDAKRAEVAAEIVHRSRHEHGGAGLSRRVGARTPEALVQDVADVSKRGAGVLARVGEILSVDGDPWLAPVARAVREGDMTVEKADVVRAGLGSPTAAIAADDLSDLAAHLAELAPRVTVERLASVARSLRDELDTAGVAERERQRRDRRYLALVPQPDGMTRLHGLLDPESAAIVGAAFDAATSPRRGGPRFVDSELRERADRIAADPRSTGQIALDTFVDLIRLGSEANPEVLPGFRRHAVRVLVTARDLERGSGIAFLRDQESSVSVESAARHVCDTGIRVVTVDDAGDPLDVGRDQRLHTARQREALAIRDGGCRFPECDRPVSWTEAHHTVPWAAGGRTSVRDAILLCRHHHREIHDAGWRITRDDTHGFVAIPPPSRDPAGRPVPMPPRSRVAERVWRQGPRPTAPPPPGKMNS